MEGDLDLRKKKKKTVEAQNREKKTQISLSFGGWEIIKEENAIWVSDVDLIICTCELVNEKYSGRKHLFGGRTTLKILSILYLWFFTNLIS